MPVEVRAVISLPSLWRVAKDIDQSTFAAKQTKFRDRLPQSSSSDTSPFSTPKAQIPAQQPEAHERS